MTTIDVELRDWKFHPIIKQDDGETWTSKKGYASENNAFEAGFRQFFRMQDFYVLKTVTFGPGKIKSWQVDDEGIKLILDKNVPIDYAWAEIWTHGGDVIKGKRLFRSARNYSTANAAKNATLKILANRAVKGVDVLTGACPTEGQTA